MGSVHYPLGGWLCPAELTQGLIAQLEKSEHFTALFEHKVDGLKQTEHGWLLQINGQSIEHDCVVIANGNEFASFAQSEFVPLGQVKGK
ncbi:tRNA (5-methylaminomethyl-2-thiouridylate)-methyltransferase /FAD-dependent cmnm(5)s(2)U34 oxidoreductase [Vibrio ponticus]|nr:tRNA (5-methylaminomethyl-2-thiouridylate)-methyltransferase /FAD-dependent cmnm(5)s(2)U34 oxidoreductase [Vibrio ponticus]